RQGRAHIEAGLDVGTKQIARLEKAGGALKNLGLEPLAIEFYEVCRRQHAFVEQGVEPANGNAPAAVALVHLALYRELRCSLRVEWGGIPVLLNEQLPL